jgi:hydroxymethylpyrimidine/phosphomethylpyrimidine kinase
MNHLLTIAGSDCSGGAGIQADMKTFAAHGAYGMSVITSIVAENTNRVISSWDVAKESICDQIDAVFEDIRVDGVKVGMIPDEGAVKAVADKIRQYRPLRPVVDPVMAATAGYDLMKKSALKALIAEVLPLAFLLTPNIPEAEAMTGIKIKDAETMKAAAVALRKMGAENVLVKGGHLKGEAKDLLFDGKSFCSFSSRRIQTQNTHGTGCSFSAAITANLAEGKTLPEAVRLAKEYITGAIRYSFPVGAGRGPVHHFYRVWRY